MIDVVMTTIASAFHGVGNLIEGVFGKQPKKEELRVPVRNTRLPYAFDGCCRSEFQQKKKPRTRPQ